MRLDRPGGKLVNVMQADCPQAPASGQRAVSKSEGSAVRQLPGDLPVAEGLFAEVAGRLGLVVGDLLAKGTHVGLLSYLSQH
jgi:hypothetical protein